MRRRDGRAWEYPRVHTEATWEKVPVKGVNRVHFDRGEKGGNWKSW